MALTDIKCRTAKAEDRPYKMADSGGLFLFVTAAGAKSWRLKYRFAGKEKLFVIGPYPLVSLREARDAREEAKKKLQKGIDPAEARKEEKRQAVEASENTFKAVALEWHEAQKGKWSPKHAANVMRRLEADVFPRIGRMNIAKIEPVILLGDCLRHIETRNALDIAGRVKQICGQIFRYGIITGRCERDPTHDLQGALKVRRTQHFAAIEPDELPELLAALDKNDARLFARTRRAIRLSLLTFVRPGELRQAEWSEIDLKGKLWTIPAKKMKMGRTHLVPLSKQAIAVLREQYEETELLRSPYVFPSQVRPKEPLSDGTVRLALQRLGFKNRMVAHGFRALARTAIREKLSYEPDVIEAQLAHKPAGALGAAYDRAQFLKQREKMMQDWADFLDGISGGKK